MSRRKYTNEQIETHFGCMEDLRGCLEVDNSKYIYNTPMVTALMHFMITELAEQQPEDPLLFLAEAYGPEKLPDTCEKVWKMCKKVKADRTDALPKVLERKLLRRLLVVDEELPPPGEACKDKAKSSKDSNKPEEDQLRMEYRIKFLNDVLEID